MNPPRLIGSNANPLRLLRRAPPGRAQNPSPAYGTLRDAATPLRGGWRGRTVSSVWSDPAVVSPGIVVPRPAMAGACLGNPRHFPPPVASVPQNGAMPQPWTGDLSAIRRSVLLVEDEPLLRDLVASALEQRGYEVTTAGSVPDAVRAFRVADPDGVVMDVDLGPGPNGFDLAESFIEQRPDLAVLFLTHLPDPRFAGRPVDGLPPGVAYLRKSALHNADEVARALDAVLRGAVGASLRHDRDPGRPFASLTRRQVEFLRLVAQGYTNAQIATQRGITLQAVENTITRAFAKLGLEDDPSGNHRVLAVRRFIHWAGDPLPAVVSGPVEE